MSYTEKLHAHRLKLMYAWLERHPERTCQIACPVFRGFTGEEIKIAQGRKMEGVCKICCEFVGLTESHTCPCRELGAEEAAKRTFTALEEKGYL